MNKLKTLLASFFLLTTISVLLGTVGLLSYGVFSAMLDNFWLAVFNIGFSTYAVYIFYRRLN